MIFFRSSTGDTANKSNTAPNLKFAVMENTWKICKLLMSYDVKGYTTKEETLELYFVAYFGLGSDISDD